MYSLQNMISMMIGTYSSTVSKNLYSIQVVCDIEFVLFFNITNISVCSLVW